MTHPEQYTYYDYDGAPCRVLDMDNLEEAAAERYVKGKGFVPGNLLGIYFEGVRISEKEFKEMIKRLIAEKWLGD